MEGCGMGLKAPDDTVIPLYQQHHREYHTVDFRTWEARARRKATVFTSSGLNWSDKFATIAEAAKLIPANAAVFDGEIMVHNVKGFPDFGALRAAIGREPRLLLFYAFDLLHLDGYDLRGAALSDGRCILTMLMDNVPRTHILMSETIDKPGDILFGHACKISLKGIVAKCANAPYRSGRVET
jgi:bifunctional non-homologous end joining protein LigD